VEATVGTWVGTAVACCIGMAVRGAVEPGCSV
jgi:hypothetical protein